MALKRRKEVIVPPLAKPVLGSRPSEATLRSLDESAKIAAAQIADDTVDRIVPPSASGAPVSTWKPAAGGWIVGEVGASMTVPLANLRENRFNSRQVVSQKDHQEMMKLLEKEGQLEDCAGYREGSTITLYSGHRRLRAARDLGWTELRVKLVEPPADEMDAFVLCDRYNVGHKPQSDLDRALSYRKLLEAKVVSGPQELAKRQGLNETLVSKLLGIAKLPEQIVTAVADTPSMMSLNVLYQVYRFHEDRGLPETMTLLANCADEPLSVREIEGRRKLAMAPVRSKPRSQRQTFAFAGAKGELKRFDLEGRLDLHIKGLSEASLVELEDKIARLVDATPELSGIKVT